jgi:hypothetical protein
VLLLLLEIDHWLAILIIELKVLILLHLDQMYIAPLLNEIPWIKFIHEHLNDAQLVLLNDGIHELVLNGHQIFDIDINLHEKLFHPLLIYLEETMFIFHSL